MTPDKQITVSIPVPPNFELTAEAEKYIQGKLMEAWRKEMALRDAALLHGGTV